MIRQRDYTITYPPTPIEEIRHRISRSDPAALPVIDAIVERYQQTSELSEDDMRQLRTIPDGWYLFKRTTGAA
jgi:hypothetical protein